MAHPPAAGRAAGAAVRRKAVYVHQFKINAKAAFEGRRLANGTRTTATWARDDGMPQAAGE